MAYEIKTDLLVEGNIKEGSQNLSDKYQAKGNYESSINKNTAFNKNFETNTNNIKTNGSVSVGSLDTVARADHVHPTDTTRAAASDLTSHINNKENPHNVTKTQIGLGNVGNFKAVSTVANQGLNETEKTNARTNIGAASASHGNHVPTVETADNNRFLRNDNTWQTVTPANIGAATTEQGNKADSAIQNITMNGETLSKTNGSIDLGTVITSHQNISNKAEKSETVSTVSYDTTNKKITKTINNKTTDVVSASTLKTDMDLSNVENKSSATIREELTSSNVTTALGYTPLNSNLKGSNSGLAELDSTGKVPSSQLPSFVDDVLEYNSKSSFPTTGETGKIYVDTTTNLTWRWSGTTYVEISPSIALGETSSTAYRGDRGKIAYDHSQATHARTDATKVESSSTNGNIKINGTETTVYTHPGSGTNPHGTTKSDVGLSNVGNFKAVSTVASQGLTDTEKANARANIGAGTSSLALGETSSTAYRGDRGKTAYDHSQATHARTDATKVESSTTNGNIKINGTETTVYTHPSGTNPHGTTKSDVGLGNVGNFKAVSTVANQGLSDTEKANARANIGAGMSSFSGSYNDLSNKPTLGTAAAKDVASSGNATTSQVVMGNDTRLSDSRPASDVSAWAKASTKPTYTASEVGAATSGHTHSISIATSSGTNQITLAANTKYSITAGGSSYIFTTPPGATYGIATTSVNGLVKSSTANNSIAVNSSTGVMTINNITTDKLISGSATLILDCGDSST